jgi:hypothetical protein
VNGKGDRPRPVDRIKWKQGQTILEMGKEIEFLERICREKTAAYKRLKDNT